MTSIVTLDPDFEAAVRHFLIKVITSDTAVQWIESPHIRVYMRRRTRKIDLAKNGDAIPHDDYITLWQKCGFNLDKTLHSVIDVANVAVEPQRCGIYSAFLRLLDECAAGRIIYIENVHDREQHGIYERRGFVKHNKAAGLGFDTEAVCFYKLPETSGEQNA